MFTLSPVEGLARAILSFLPAPLGASNQNSLTSISPTPLSRAPFESDTRPSRKSNYSRTSAIPGVGGIYRFSCQTSSSRSCYRTPLSALFPFRHLRTLSFFVSHLSAVLPVSSALLPQKPGGIPPGPTNPTVFLLRSDHSSSPSTVDCQLSTSSPILPSR
jgi:hypothetical protein